MSLINQALKKEQQRRSLNLKAPPEEIPSYESQPLSANQVARRDQGRNPAALLLGFAGLGLFLLVCGGAVVYFGKSYLSTLKPEQTIAAKGPEAIVEASSPDTNSTVAQALEGQSERAATVDAIAQSAESDPVQESVANKNLAAEEGVPPEAVVESPKFNMEAQAHIDSLQVHGFRSAGSNSRLLMSGKVYKIGDFVSHEFALRFLGSQNDRLVFEDINGFRYEKPL